MTTFAEFQATGRDSADLGAELHFDGGDTIAVGRIYKDAYYIDDTANWPGEYPRWHLLLERDEYFSDDLADLERRLYRWWVGQDTEELVEEALNAAVKTVQDRLGIKTGDLASHFFSGSPNGKDIRLILANYIATEAYNGD